VNLPEIIAALEKQIQDPKKGLPEEVFLLVSRITPLVNVDLLIQNKSEGTLLSWRQDGLCPAGWHIPGGIIRFKEKIEDRIKAVAKNELGAEVTFDPLPLCVNEIQVPTRENRSHFISFLYRCTLVSAPKDTLRFNGISPKVGEWDWHKVSPSNLIPTHDRLYKPFIENL